MGECYGKRCNPAEIMICLNNIGYSSLFIDFFIIQLVLFSFVEFADVLQMYYNVIIILHKVRSNCL